MGKQTSTQTTILTPILAIMTIKVTEKTKNQELPKHLVRPVVKQPLHRKMLFWRECRFLGIEDQQGRNQRPGTWIIATEIVQAAA